MTKIVFCLRLHVYYATETGQFQLPLLRGTPIGSEPPSLGDSATLMERSNDSMRVPHSAPKVVDNSNETMSMSENSAAQDGVSGDVNLDLKVKLRFLKHPTPLGKIILFAVAVVLLIIVLWFTMKIGRPDLVDEVLHILANLL